MCKLPSKFKSGPSTWTIVKREAAEMNGAFGQSDPRKMVITIATDLSPDAERSTFFHELLHTAFDTSGAWEVFNKAAAAGEKEEAVVRCLENPLLQILRDNPKVMEYLLHGR